MKSVLSSLVWLTSLGVSANDKPADFTDVGSLLPTVQINMAYLGSDNFVGAPVDGYEANKCYLQHDAAIALGGYAKADRDGIAIGFGFGVFGESDIGRKNAGQCK